MKNNSISQKQACTFVKMNGVPFVKGISVWELVSLALVNCGIERYENETSEYFIDRNKSIIMEKTVGKISRKKKRYNKKNKLSNRIIEFKKQTSQEFLKSWEWTTLRMEAIKLYGRTCMCCGAKHGVDGVVIHVDHIKPRSKYPELSLELKNLQILCHDCNKGKGAWDETDWRTDEQKSMVGAL